MRRCHTDSKTKTNCFPDVYLQALNYEPYQGKIKAFFYVFYLLQINSFWSI